MRILLVADIHSNFVALETVLAAAGTYDTIWCLGDIIGYGPAPNECVDTIKRQASISICGNHDLACIGRLNLNDFNFDARRANIWNSEQLTPENYIWMENLEPMHYVDSRFMLAHGSPRAPVWEYLLTPEQANENGTYFRTQICFIGHSHVQLGFRLDPSEHCERFLPDPGQMLSIESKSRFIINPGSVGQPRDQDPRSAYAILDTDAGFIRFERVEYDIRATQRHMSIVDLPPALIRRLEFGM